MDFKVNLNKFNYPHFTVPSLNCSVQIDKGVKKNYVTEYYELQYDCSLPIPFGDPCVLNEKYIYGFDRVTTLVNDKKMWEITRDDIICQSSKFNGNDVVKTRFKNVKKVYYGTLQLAKHLMTDPDPNFSGFYNWYFSDGCVNTLFHSNINFLLYSNYKIPGTCHITPLEINDSKCIPTKDNNVLLRTGHKEPIFQVCVNNDFIVLRQKHFTSLFTLINEEEFKFKKIHSNCEMKESFVSTSICDDLDGEYCTLTTSHTLKIWSPEIKNDCITQARIKSSCRNRSNCDHWGSVKYLTNNNILVSTRSYVYLKDTRMELDENAQKWKTNVDKCSCDEISLLLRDKSVSTHAFVGTTHYLYELDFRMGLSKQWTHMLEFPPTCGVVVGTNTSNNILIGSQNINEVCLIDSSLNILPYLLPTPKETLNQANSQGLCIDPIVASRFNFSMVGFTAFSDHNADNKMVVFRKTCMDDIFYQNIIHKEETDIGYARDFNNETDLLSEWEAKCLQSDVLISKYINVTKIKDCYNVYNKINNQNLLGTYKTNKPKFTKFKCPKLKVKNKFSQSLLDVWEIDDLNNSQENVDETEDNFAIDVDNNDEFPSSSNNITLPQRQLDEVFNNVGDAQNVSNFVTPTKHNPNMLIMDEFNDLFNDVPSTSNVSSFRRTPIKSQINKKKSRISSGF